MQIGQVGFSTHVSGYPTSQDLVPNVVQLQHQGA
jgi:hypothetical protein